MFGEEVVATIGNVLGKAADKLWMDKDEKAKLEFDKERFTEQIGFAVKELQQNGELAHIEAIFKESEAQREYAQKQFGTASMLKDFRVGRVILFGRASIRWAIVGFCSWQTHRIVSYILTADVIKALGAGTLSASAIWVVALLVALIVGIPLFYVTGISIEKIMKSRGVI